MLPSRVRRGASQQVRQLVEEIVNVSSGPRTIDDDDEQVETAASDTRKWLGRICTPRTC